MLKLLQKELRLCMHPTAPIFLLLSAMLLIPNYPYYVAFFYTGLAVFFTCLTGREQHDVAYTLSLPVRKRDAVRARFLFTVLLQLAQLLLAVPFLVLRARSACRKMRWAWRQTLRCLGSRSCSTACSTWCSSACTTKTWTA